MESEKAKENEQEVERSQEKMWQCNECDVKITNKKQLETHKRLKHVDVIHFNCSQCPYSSRTKENMSKHAQNNHQQESNQIKCKICEIRAITQKEVDTQLQV